ncbi:uncharacterized protein LOC143580733 [Bidens hawaiensis]|uniref:uncharacterized protein LOC143580733 n=1 Tax=Bidens hawaiensis TaxID=980011 RepID=UPI00404B7F4F
MSKTLENSVGSGGVWPCPFRGFHCCPDGRARSKGISRLIAHIKRLHLSLDERKGTLRDAISTDCDLLISVGEALKASDQWLCGMCMRPNALKRTCHHADGVTKYNEGVGAVEEFIVGIDKPHVMRNVAPLGGIVADEVLLDRVFSLPITTVKSIPHSCRMAFSQALTAALGKVVTMTESVEAWVKLFLLPRCTLRVFRPSKRQERRSSNRKSLQCHSIQQALTTWGVKDGNDTLKALVAKHPNLPPPVMPASLLSEPPLVVDEDCVLGCIKSFPKGTACGRDGLRAQHILDAFCGEGSSIAVGLLKVITAMVNLCLGRGGCPRVLAEFIASAPLTPLLKPDNGIRPIAVGAIWRRLISKVAMRGVRKDITKYLCDFQFGVGVPSGAEVVLHSAKSFLSRFHSDGSLAMLTIDFCNAFNLVDRTALLNEVRARCPSISCEIGTPVLGVKLLGEAKAVLSVFGPLGLKIS